MTDAAIADGVVDAQLFAFLEKTLVLMEEGLDYEILTNIFEIQVLDRFGVRLNFHECVFCHRVGLPFDFSYKFSGLLCPNHYEEDERRSHLDPNVPYLLDRFQGLSFEELRSISVKDEMKRKLRQFIDELYDLSLIHICTTISLLSNSSNDSYIACSVKGEDGSQIFGIISSYNNKKKLLEMTQLNSSSDVKVGSEVVTSGLDEVSVKDVPIGKVESVIDYEDVYKRQC